MMNLVRCPRCELNYMLKGEKVCKVCQREVEGDRLEDDVEMCSVCGQAPAMPGREVCLDCFKEMEDDAESKKENGVDIEPEVSSDDRDNELDEAVTAELGQMGNELSLDDVVADEERQADDEDPEEI